MNPYEPPKDALKPGRQLLDAKKSPGMLESLAQDGVAILAAGLTAMLILIVYWIVS